MALYIRCRELDYSLNLSFYLLSSSTEKIIMTIELLLKTIGCEIQLMHTLVTLCVDSFFVDSIFDWRPSYRRRAACDLECSHRNGQVSIPLYRRGVIDSLMLSLLLTYMFSLASLSNARSTLFYVRQAATLVGLGNYIARFFFRLLSMMNVFFVLIAWVLSICIQFVQSTFSIKKEKRSV